MKLCWVWSLEFQVYLRGLFGDTIRFRYMGKYAGKRVRFARWVLHS